MPVSDDDLTLGEQEQKEKRLAAVQAALLGMEELFALALDALAMAGILCVCVCVCERERERER